MATAKSSEPRLSDEELVAIRNLLRDGAFSNELRKRLGGGLVTAEKIATAVFKLCVMVGLIYASSVTVLKHMVGISK